MASTKSEHSNQTSSAQYDQMGVAAKTIAFNQLATCSFTISTTLKLQHFTSAANTSTNATAYLGRFTRLKHVSSGPRCTRVLILIKDVWKIRHVMKISR